ncbi:putative cytochrome p450 hydroxylase [Anoxybacillus flavithermus NBRC 109594]|uniref:Putative cytochrome p450 hydroxylase n=1 Tax=Anoxybacillus flavithermus NBRC 109594 TaxID=1315967 RepID=R4G1C0_9BACL|nr:alkaline phosphatase family protein [Anoxybacillus flavithermus]GAC91758.1 putative cytochrome p450 hydroxylase [Anoxybacillus flavithermus NBRC 109594]
MSERTKLIIIGLDCAEPDLVFDIWKGEFPTLERLMNTGQYSRMKSTIPPITVPAWTAMVTGLNPGQLGCYGFRNRKDYSYDGYSLAYSNTIKAKRVWEILGEHGLKSIILGVPQTYPVQPAPNTLLVSCFLTPDTEHTYTYPQSLSQEIAEVIGKYQFDIKNFRSSNYDEILQSAYNMLDQRFKLAEHLVTTKEWDFFMMVDIGLDRIQHAFWKFVDKKHVLYEENPQYADVIYNYYQRIDKHISQLLKKIPGNARVMVVSDHGAKRMDGGIRINEWLIQKGYLKLKSYPITRTSIHSADIDWANTKAWGDGGYYGRIFLNVRGREPEGSLAPEEYEEFRNRLIEELTNIKDPHGREIGTKVFKPEEIYGECMNIAPDLIVYFGDLYWRSIGSIGDKGIWTYENDTGPDGANHSQYGLFISAVNQADFMNNDTGEREPIEIYDIAPSILKHFGIAVPTEMRGRAISL